jgi:hypothetical protein
VRVIADSNLQITTPPQACVVLCTVDYPALLLPDIVARINVEFFFGDRHYPNEQEPQLVSVERGCLQHRRFDRSFDHFIK